MKAVASNGKRLSPERMYAALMASDPAFNGRFFTGVLTTGIYCLPSCRARKPLRNHVQFFPSTTAAREAGLRPCKKCHPDDFARGADPVLESIETLVSEVRANPGAFANAAAIVRRSGFGATRLFELLRQHYQITPADLLLRARLDLARQKLLAGSATLAFISSEVGFESLSVFHENFRRLNGLTPGAYRALPSAKSFTLALPPGYPLPYLRRALGRDTQSVSEQLKEDVYTCALHLNGEATWLTLRLSSESVETEVASAHLAPAAHAVVVRLLGLDQEAAAFARLAKRLGLARLVSGREEMRIAQAHTVFDGLLWAIIGQQINFAFACVLRRRLIELAGTRLDSGLYAPPDPAAVASLSQADLTKLQFSRQKADFTLGLARAVVDGQLNPDGLSQMSATRAERTLLALHGFGPWSVNYVMMRALSFADCVPWGDTGVSSGLQALFALEERPDVPAARRLMAVFSPYRSLATAHLWQFNRTAPE